jgi:hypothetical protein
VRKVDLAIGQNTPFPTSQLGIGVTRYFTMEAMTRRLLWSPRRVPHVGKPVTLGPRRDLLVLAVLGHLRRAAEGPDAAHVKRLPAIAMIGTLRTHRITPNSGILR